MLNDELVTARAAVVSKLLVIAPYSADLSRRQSGVQTGEKPRRNRSAEINSGGLLRRVSPSARWSPANDSLQVSKAVITSAAFVASGTELVNRGFGAGIFGLTGFGNNKPLYGERDERNENSF